MLTIHLEEIFLALALVVTLGMGIFTLYALRRQERITDFFAEHPELFPYTVLRTFEQDIGIILAIHQLVGYAMFAQMGLVGSLICLDTSYIYAALLTCVWGLYLAPRINEELNAWRDETEHELEMHRKVTNERVRPKHLRLISRN